MTVTPQQATDAANEAFGRHPGLRALHAKGTLLKGTFTAAPAGGATDPSGAHAGRGDPGDDQGVERRREPRRPRLRARTSAGSR